VLTTSSIGSASVGRGPQPASAGAVASRAITAPAAEETAPRRASTRSNSDTTASKQLPPRAARGSLTAAESTIAESAGLSDTRAEEVLQLQQELADTKVQAAGLQKENRALLKALQESKQRQNDAESTISALSSQPHPEQVPELLLEVSKLNAALQQQEGGLRACALRWHVICCDIVLGSCGHSTVESFLIDLFMVHCVERELALKRQYQHLKDQLSDLQRQHSKTEARWDEARADYRDVLRLVDIMVASPAGIRAVLEAYLKKLGTLLLLLCVCGNALLCLVNDVTIRGSEGGYTNFL
jgi:chromosome segregation ATPase